MVVFIAPDIGVQDRSATEQVGLHYACSEGLIVDTPEIACHSEWPPLSALSQHLDDTTHL